MPLRKKTTEEKEKDHFISGTKNLGLEWSSKSSLKQMELKTCSDRSSSPPGVNGANTVETGLPGGSFIKPHPSNGRDVVCVQQLPKHMTTIGEDSATPGGSNGRQGRKDVESSDEVKEMVTSSGESHARVSGQEAGSCSNCGGGGRDEVLKTGRFNGKTPQVLAEVDVGEGMDGDGQSVWSLSELSGVGEDDNMEVPEELEDTMFEETLHDANNDGKRASACKCTSGAHKKLTMSLTCRYL